MANLTIDPKKIAENGWKQGACLIDPQIHIEERFKKFEAYILLSQDCDVLNHSLIKEPYVEFIGAKFIKVDNGQFNAGKNPRQLHLQLQIGGEKKYLEIFPNDRLLVIIL